MKTPYPNLLLRVLLAVFSTTLFASLSGADDGKVNALEAAKKLVGTYTGNWNSFGLDDNGELVPKTPWTDVVLAANPTLKNGRAYITATDKMTYPNGSTYPLQWTEGFFVNPDGSAGDRYFDIFGVISIEKQTGPDTWVIEADASAQELAQLGITNASYGHHSTFKNVVHGAGFETEFVTRRTSVKFTNSKGKVLERQFVSMKGSHKHMPL